MAPSSTSKLLGCLVLAATAGQVGGFGVVPNKAPSLKTTSSTEPASSTSRSMGSLVNDFKRRVHWKMEKAQRSASIYMNPATKKLGNVTISWEPSVARQILDLQEARKHEATNRPLMVGVVGIPGSGKSTSADILASFLEKSIVMPLDGYHYAMEELQKFPNPADAIYRRGAPDTFDPASLQRDLDRIVNSAHDAEPMVSIPGFDHARGDPEVDAHTFVRDQHDVVICEGIYLMHDEDGWQDIKSYMDWIIYIAADVELCVDRLKQRNKCIPGYTPEEIEIRCEKVDRVNAETVERSRKYASVEVVSGAAPSPLKSDPVEAVVMA